MYCKCKCRRQIDVCQMYQGCSMLDVLLCCNRNTELYKHDLTLSIERWCYVSHNAMQSQVSIWLHLISSMFIRHTEILETCHLWFFFLMGIITHQLSRVFNRFFVVYCSIKPTVSHTILKWCLAVPGAYYTVCNMLVFCSKESYSDWIGQHDLQRV